MSVAIIAAVAEHGVIGRDGKLPWRLKADLKRFKSLTMGHPIIMGRRTWESIGRPLPGRTSIVITRQSRYATPFAEVQIAHDWDDAHRLALAAPGGDVESFAIGGAAVYSAALPHARRLYLTRVLASVDGDAHFPPHNEAEWKLLTSEEHAADADNDYPHWYEVYERVLP
jgi:dihydrofolate reductase